MRAVRSMVMDWGWVSGAEVEGGESLPWRLLYLLNLIT